MLYRREPKPISETTKPNNISDRVLPTSQNVHCLTVSMNFNLHEL